MNRTWGRLLVLITGALFAGVVAPACASNDQSVFIRQVAAPPASRQNGSCLYTVDPTLPFLSEGTLDVGVRDDYYARLIYGNQLSARADRTANRTESNRVTLNGAVVRVTTTDGTLIREFTSVSTGFADPAVGDTPSYGVLAVTIIDRATRDLLANGLNKRADTKLVIANVKGFGQTLGGVDVESNEFSFPIRVCKGCLVSFEKSNDVNLQPAPNCLLALAEGTPLPCLAGQDEVTPCQVCRGRDVCDDPTKL
jgi:hypothetical protein